MSSVQLKNYPNYLMWFVFSLKLKKNNYLFILCDRKVTEYIDNIFYFVFKKVDMICKFVSVKPTITNENIKNIKKINIAYVKPHIIN